MTDLPEAPMPNPVENDGLGLGGTAPIEDLLRRIAGNQPQQAETPQPEEPASEPEPQHIEPEPEPEPPKPEPWDADDVDGIIQRLKVQLNDTYEEPERDRIEEDIATLRAVRAASMVNNRIEHEQKRAHLGQNQAQSETQAIQAYPDLQDSNSRMFQFTRQIWMNDEGLRQSPFGPLHAANSAAQLLGITPGAAAKQAPRLEDTSTRPTEAPEAENAQKSLDNALKEQSPHNRQENIAQWLEQHQPWAKPRKEG